VSAAATGPAWPTRAAQPHAAGAAGLEGLVHGMGKEPAEPDWPPLTADEVAPVLAQYGLPGTGHVAVGTAVTWRSPRPMSAAGLVRQAGGDAFMKRHDPRVRSTAQLAAEHAFIAHLRARGFPVPAVRRTADGASAVRSGGFVYEVHDVAAGTDLYRDAVSWSPFRSLGHARAAGAALARLHRAAAGFARPARRQAVLIGSCAVVTAPDPVAAIGRMIRQRPGLGRALRSRPWPQDVERHLAAPVARAAPLLRSLPRQWVHGDWHPSNLTWTAASAQADVAAAFDLGLANRGFAVHDLGTALERSTITWLDLAESGRAAADLDAVDALLDGYESVRPLSPAETAALAGVLPVVHVEYALSELEYFADVVGSAANADLAYEGYLLGHVGWFGTAAGTAVAAHLRARRARQLWRANRPTADDAADQR
jgi:Ser/Thr protein kinase RdoA (MazF antagonist)